MPVNFKNPDFKMSGKQADKDYYTDENGEVTDDPAKQRFLLVRAGQDMTTDVAEKIGGLNNEEGSSAEGEEKASAPKANKKAQPSKNKGVK